MDRKTIIKQLQSRSHALVLQLLVFDQPPVEVVRRLVGCIDRLDRTGDPDTFEHLDLVLKEITDNDDYGAAREAANAMRLTLDALDERSLTLDYCDDRVHIRLSQNDYLELITTLRGLVVTAQLPASVQFEVGRYTMSFTVFGEPQPDYQPAVLLSLSEAFEMQYRNARECVYALDDDERTRLARLCISLEGMNPESAIPLLGVDRLRAATRLPDLFPPVFAEQLWLFYASVKSLAAMAQALLLLGVTPVRELTSEPHAEKAEPKFVLIEDRGDNCTVECGLCGEVFYTDVTGENCARDVRDAFVPKCPKCGASRGW